MEGSDDKTQAPSERRQLQAREDGQAPLSRELVTAAGLAGAALVLALGAPAMAQSLMAPLQRLLAGGASPEQALNEAGHAWMLGAGPMMAVVAAMGAGAVLLQTGFLLNANALLPDVSRLDPRKGLKRVFGLDNLVESLKALVKLGVLSWAAWSAVAVVWPGAHTALLWTPGTMVHHLWAAMLRILLLVLAAQCAIALLDTVWTRWRFTQRLRMSLTEQKQEMKEADGDPKIKARLRHIRLSRARKRMLAAVAKATVVVTNPTHYAIALSYQRGGAAAPRVVAKGMDDVAARIREAAEKAGVPLVPNPPLARALYLVALDAEVPEEHFKLVAEVIAYVWRLRGLAGRSR